MLQLEAIHHYRRSRRRTGMISKFRMLFFVLCSRLIDVIDLSSIGSLISMSFTNSDSPQECDLHRMELLRSAIGLLDERKRSEVLEIRLCLLERDARMGKDTCRL